MARDSFESVCVIPSDGFDEVWFVVHREQKRFIERMSLRLQTSNCERSQVLAEDQIFMDCAVTYGETQILITSISNTNPVVVTAPGHGLSNGDTIRIEGVLGMTELNGRTFIVTNKTTDTFELYE